MLPQIRAGLVAHADPKVVDELLEAHAEAKRNFYEGGHRLQAVEGGRFCEAAYRILSEVTTGSFTPLNKQINAQAIDTSLANLPGGSHPDSIRLHIPRALRVIYDVRNNRDTAHLADGIDPSLQDATLVVSVLDWVLAEFIRLFHNVTADEAQRIVEDLVTRSAPVIELFDGEPRILRTDLRAGDYALLLLYHRGAEGATLEELRQWVRPGMVANLARTLATLDDKALIHAKGGRFRITQAGKKDVEARRLHQPDE